MTWSFSRLETFEQCGMRYRFRYIDRIKEPPPAEDDPRARGDGLHKRLEAQVMGGPLEPTFERYHGLIRELQGAPGLSVEKQWAIDRDWNFVASWSDKRAWGLAKLDVYHQNAEPGWVNILDWKSGKVYPDKHRAQGDLYTCIAEAKERSEGQPFLGAVVEMVYLDRYESTVQTVPKHRLPIVRENFTKRVEVMERATDFAPNPSKLCGWCPYGKKRGLGNCKHAQA